MEILTFLVIRGAALVIFGWLAHESSVLITKGVNKK